MICRDAMTMRGEAGLERETRDTCMRGGRGRGRAGNRGCFVTGRMSEGEGEAPDQSGSGIDDKAGGRREERTRRVWKNAITGQRRAPESRIV